MKKRIIFALMIVCIVAIIVAGCTSTVSTGASTQATTAPTSAVPTQIPSPVTTIETATPTTTVAIVTQTPIANPDPTDVSKIQFTKYSDNDFSLEYPSTWNVSKSGEYIGYNVTFTSADHNQKFVAYVFGGLGGNFVVNPTCDRGKNEVSYKYQDLGGSDVSDCQYAQSGNTMTSRYTLTTPKGSAEYPLAYTTKTFVTVHDIFEFSFISDDVNILKYHDLKEYMFSSITTNDIS